MEQIKRFAIYYAPASGAFADFGARWLGWDAASGESCAYPELPNLPRPVTELTDAPRKYGLHGTLRAPFRLAKGKTPGALIAACADLASRHIPVRTEGLRLARLGGFLALVPAGDATGIETLAAACVRETNDLRAPLTETEFARRRPERLNRRQRMLLERWGYPYVLEEFRFHVTLSGNLSDEEAVQVETALAPILAPILPVPFVINDICVFGEDATGMFHLLRRFPLGKTPQV